MTFQMILHKMFNNDIPDDIPDDDIRVIDDNDDDHSDNDNDDRYSDDNVDNDDNICEYHNCNR